MLNASDKDLRKVRITSVDQIKCGRLVAFISTPADLNNGKALLTRGFIRSINGNTARIGNYLVRVDINVIKYLLEK